jgi:hypothetical protein
LQAERVLLRRLSVFAGGWTLEAAEAVCEGEGIEQWEILELQSHLIDKSLVLAEAGVGGETRYRLLGTIRQYAWDRLVEAGEAARLPTRHRDWFLELVEKAESELRGPDQALWLDRLELEHDNLQAALEWSQTDEGGAEPGLRMAGALYRFWYVRGYLSEGRQWLEAALVRSSGAASSARAKVLQGAGAMALNQADPERGGELLDEALALYRGLGDKSGVARTLNTIALGELDKGQAEHAAVHFEEGLGLSREIGAKNLICRLLNNLGELSRLRGDLEGARGRYEELLEINRGVDNQTKAIGLLNLGLVALSQSDFAAAQSYFREGLATCRKLKDKLSVAGVLEGLAGVRGRQGQPERAAKLLGAADAVRKATNYVLSAADRADYQGSVEAVRAALGEKAFASAWAEGQAMPLEQAIEYALEEEPSQAASPD